MDSQKELGHKTDCLLNCQVSTCLAKLRDEPLPLPNMFPIYGGTNIIGPLIVLWPFKGHVCTVNGEDITKKTKVFLFLHLQFFATLIKLASTKVKSFLAVKPIM